MSCDGGGAVDKMFLLYSDGLSCGCEMEYPTGLEQQHVCDGDGV